MPSALIATEHEEIQDKEHDPANDEWEIALFGSQESATSEHDSLFSCSQDTIYFSSQESINDESKEDIGEIGQAPTERDHDSFQAAVESEDGGYDTDTTEYARSQNSVHESRQSSSSSLGSSTCGSFDEKIADVVNKTSNGSRRLRRVNRESLCCDDSLWNDIHSSQSQ